MFTHKLFITNAKLNRYKDVRNVDDLGCCATPMNVTRRPLSNRIGVISIIMHARNLSPR